MRIGIAADHGGFGLKEDLRGQIIPYQSILTRGQCPPEKIRRNTKPCASSAGFQIVTIVSSPFAVLQ